MPRARRIRPTTLAGRSGEPGESARESGTGLVLCLVGRGSAAGVAVGTGDGVMTGKSCVALPASMSVLPTPFRSGIGPSGNSGSGRGLSSGALCDRAEVTAVVSATVGAFHFCVVTMLAVAVSQTDLTEVALDATATWACRMTGRFAETVLTVQAAVSSPLVQPWVNVAFWLVGWVVSVTDTSEADVFRVETRTI
jgi:hypothetical protein